MVGSHRRLTANMQPGGRAEEKYAVAVDLFPFVLPSTTPVKRTAEERKT